MKLLSLAIAIAMFLVFCAPKSLAGYAEDPDPLGTAAQRYVCRDYEGAKVILLRVVSKSPTWKAYYQLANCYLRLKDGKNAKESYQKCLSFSPDTMVKRFCNDAIAYIDRTPSLMRPHADDWLSRATSSSNDDNTAADPGAHPSNSATPDKSAAVQALRKRIMAEAEQQAARVRRETNDRLEELRAGSNQRVIMPDGSVTISIDPGVELQVNSEAQRKIKQIMEDAQRRADRL